MYFFFYLIGVERTHGIYINSSFNILSSPHNFLKISVLYSMNPESRYSKLLNKNLLFFSTDALVLRFELSLLCPAGHGRDNCPGAGAPGPPRGGPGANPGQLPHICLRGRVGAREGQLPRGHGGAFAPGPLPLFCPNPAPRPPASVCLVYNLTTR